MHNKPLLLVIDDEITILKTLKAALEDEQYRIETLEDGSKTLDTIGKLIPDLVLLDIFMPNVNGLTLLEKIKKEYPQQKVIIISGFGNIPMAIEATKKGALDFIEKPLNLDEILSKISFLKNEKNTSNITPEKNKTNLQDYGIVGQSYLFLELVQQVTQIAHLKIPLLIYGQHGTGKSLFAKYAHRQNYPNLDNFYEINCAAIPNKKISEQFEYILTNKIGTILIKNIEQLELDDQKNLLFLMEKQKAFKIITTSCVSLFDLVKLGKFNNPLFNFLNITPIEIPPLNKRRYDIPLLVDYFLKKSNDKNNKNISFDSKSLRLLRNHDWQENITTLKNLIERIVLTTPDITVITAEILTNFLSEKKMQFLEEQSFLNFASLQEATSEFEKNFILYLLKKNKFDVKQVCEKLDLTPIQLRDKMFKLNIETKI